MIEMNVGVAGTKLDVGTHITHQYNKVIINYKYSIIHHM